MSTSLPKILLHRWYVVLVGIVATVGLTLAASMLVKPTYEATANVLLVPPTTHSGGNPYLELGGLEPVADVLSRSLAEDSTGRTLKRMGLTGKYSVARDQSVSGPVIILTGSGDSAREALAMVRGITSLVGPQLARLQEAAAVKPTARLTATTLNASAKATAVTKSHVRAQVAAGIGGLVLTLIAVFGIERLAMARARRRNTHLDAADHTHERRPQPREHLPAPTSAPATASVPESAPAPTSEHASAHGHTPAPTHSPTPTPTSAAGNAKTSSRSAKMPTARTDGKLSGPRSTSKNTRDRVTSRT